MSYADSRDAAQLDYLRIRTLQFIQRWHGRAPGTKRRTLFLMPGGMGSALFKATGKYLPGGPPVQKFGYEMIWLDPCSFLGEALRCEMVWDQADQTYHDIDNKIVVADGSAELVGIDPYAGFTDWCDANDIDWFVFGWDWRRPVTETATFFTGQFLPMFKATVHAACGVDPLADYSVVGHSEGGMVVNALMRGGALPAGLTAAIAVASPFYGYGGQIHRWFEGDDMFFLLDTMDVIRVISSLPGLYVLPFLDQATWQRDRVALGQDTYPLAAYPSVGAKAPVVDVDPFVFSNKRYPTGTGFDQRALAAGLAEYQALSAPMPDPNGVFHVIRGVRLKSNGKPAKQTKGGLTWATLDPNKAYKPSNTPLTDTAKVPGDGTLPAWSTHLVGTPSIVVADRDVEHAFLMEQAPVQQEIATILGLGAAPLPAIREAVMSAQPPKNRVIASQAELEEFKAQLKAATADAPTTIARRRLAQQVFERQRTTKLKALAARLIANFGRPPERPVKVPPAKYAGTAKAKRKPPAKAKPGK